ncbi:MAG: hypothetical protein RR436_04515 [Clostridia bacterium]
MNNKLFNFGLFKESLLQNKLPGIIFVVLSVVASAIMPISEIVSMGHSSTVYQPDIFSFGIAAIVLMYIAPFVLVFNQFSFLNKRNSSDIYHSMPISRRCMSFTMLMSCVAWEFVIIVPSIIITTTLFLISGAVVNFVLVPYLIFSLIAGYLLLTATTFIAVELSGTIFSSIIVTGLITFLPRFILYAFKFTVDSLVEIASIGSSTPLFDDLLNIPVGGLLTVFTGSPNRDKFLNNIDSIVYTFIVAIICICIGLFVARKRKSETALKSAPSFALQNIFRICITLPWIILMAAIVSNDPFNLLNYLIPGSFAILTYVIYELITTRKFKNVIKSLPYMLILLAVGVVFYFGVVGTKTLILNDIPNPNDIKSISFAQDQSNKSKTLEYNIMEVTNIKYTDKALNEIIVNSLKTTIVDVKQKNYQRYREGYDQVVVINLKSGRKITRKIRLRQDASDGIKDIKNNSLDFEKAIKSLPTVKEIKSIDIGAGELSANHNAASLLWESFREEYIKLSSEEILQNNIISGSRDVLLNPNIGTKKTQNEIERSSTFTIGEDGRAVGTILIKGNKGKENFSSIYKITRATPNTFKLYLDLINDNNYKIFNDTVSKMKELNEDSLLVTLNADKLMENNKDTKSINYTTAIPFIEGKDIYGNDNTLLFKNDEATSRLLKMISKPLDYQKPISVINFRLNQVNNKNSYAVNPVYLYDFYVNLSEEDFEYFYKLKENIAKTDLEKTKASYENN